MRLEGTKVVFLDEAIFSFNTFSTKAWASPYQNIEVKESSLRLKTQALICCISGDIGLETYKIQPKAVNGQQFIEFLEQVSNHFNGKRIGVFLDNLSVHKTAESLAAFDRFNIVPIFNVPYSPQFNGIESYFSLLKRQYKKLVLERVLKESPVDTIELIEEAIREVEDEKTRNCVMNGCEAIFV